jgi:hypothetical protein
MKYILCQFETEETYPGIKHSGQFYQKVDSNGNVLAYVSLDGTDLVLTPPYGYNVIDVNPKQLNF